MTIKVGFIGTGVISSAVVRGILLNDSNDFDVFVSPRNADKANELAEKYESVTVCKTNQEVLDKSEWVFLSVVPGIAKEVAAQLKFRPDHRVINMVSALVLKDLKEIIGQTKTLIHMIPLSFVAYRFGPLSIFPDDAEVRKTFGMLGDIISFDSNEQIQTVQCVTSLMVPFYNMLKVSSDWGVKNGLDMEKSRDFMCSFFKSLCTNARIEDLSHLVNEMTPGGLNQMAHEYMLDKNGYAMWGDCIDPIIDRLRKDNF